MGDRTKEESYKKAIAETGEKLFDMVVDFCAYDEEDVEVPFIQSYFLVSRDGIGRCEGRAIRLHKHGLSL